MNNQKPSLFILGLSYALNSYMDLHEIVLSSVYDVTLVPIDTLINGYKRRSLSSLVAEFFHLFRFFSSSCPKYIVTVGPKVGLLTSLLSPFFSFIHIHWFTGQAWATSKIFFFNPSYLCDAFIFYSSTYRFTDSSAQYTFLIDHIPFIKNKNLQYPCDGSISYVPSSLYAIGSQRIQEPTYKFPSRSLRVGFLGRLCLEKGINVISSLASDSAYFSNVTFKVCGPIDSSIGDSSSDKTSTKLTSLLELLNNHPLVSLRVGYIDRVSFFKDVDVLILPSTREGFGSVVVEANACGIPVIGSNIYGLSDSLVHGDNGLVASSYSDYIDYIQLLSDPMIYSAFQKRSFDYSLRYTFSAMKDSLINLYSPILG